MYRCTECNAIFENCPDYCDCGNDIFEEIGNENSVQENISEVETAQNYENYEVEQPRIKRQRSAKEIEEMKLKQADREKAKMTMYVSLALCVLILISPPYLEKKNTQVAKKATVNVKLPPVNAFWDDSISTGAKKATPEDNLPLLNNSFSNISVSLHNYLLKVGENFSNNWKSSMVQGTGECKIQFVINKDGTIANKKIVQKSQNETLNDSVLLTLSKMTSLSMPPEEYKGERIILAFSAKETANKVYYPTK